MKSRVHHDPFRSELGINVDVGFQVFIDAGARVRRELGDVHGGRGVQSDGDTVLLADRAHGRNALRVEARDVVGLAVQLDVEVFDVVLRSPFHAVFDADAAVQIDADTVD